MKKQRGKKKSAYKILGDRFPKDQVETWVVSDPLEEQERRYKVNVRLGKPIDILSLKSSMIDDFDSYVSGTESTRTTLFKSGRLEKVDKCPVCGSSSEKSQFRLNLYGGLYHQCNVCTHYFLINRPSKSEIEKFYSNSVTYADTYTERRTAKIRVQQVAVPKVKWMIEQFKLFCGRGKPRSILDVGAGGGHFVYACKQLGINAKGIELSKIDREFCAKNFGIKLEALDFTTQYRTFSDVDVVTFWGVIEHTPNPVEMLKAARRVLSGRNTLVVAEVPHWNCFSTALKMPYHIDSFAHINLFTRDSLVKAFELSGFIPVAAWYFGMDAFSLVMYLSNFLKDVKVIDSLGKYIPIIQNIVDACQFSDELVIAGKPK